MAEGDIYGHHMTQDDWRKWIDFVNERADRCPTINSTNVLTGKIGFHLFWI